MGKRKRSRKPQGFVRKQGSPLKSEVRNPYKELKDKIEDDPRVLWKNLPPEDPTAISARMAQREGKTTIVIIGTSPDSCGLTPWHEPGIDEFWALNDAHHLPFMQLDKITGWFQLHQPWRYRRPTPRYGAKHWEFLQEEHHFPIYTQRVDEDIPSSVKFPLYEIAKEFLAKDGEWLLGRGMGYQRKYFACSFSFMAGLAYLQWKQGKWGDKPLRIEMYGTELAQKQEYMMQRPNTEFWVGIGIGLGVQFYVPQITRILKGVFYAYRYPSIPDMQAEIAQKKADKSWDERNWEPTPDLVDEDNVGDWPDPAGMPVVPLEFGGIFADFDDYAPEITSYGMESEIDPIEEKV